MPGYRKRWTITYETLADWAQVVPATVRNAAAKREFTPGDFNSALQWVNERRWTKGLPLMGQITGQITGQLIRPDTRENGNDPKNATQPRDKQGQ